MFEIIPTTKLVLVGTGVEGSGKTVSAATISKQFPATFPPTKPVVITDTFWLCADLHALTSMRSLNITVKDTFDIPEFLAKNPKLNYCDGIRIGLTKISEWLKAHPNGNIVIDTLSSISSGLQNNFAKDQIGQAFSVEAPADGRKMYGQLKVALSLFTDYLVEMPFGICLVLIHLKALGDMVEGNSPASIKAAKVAMNARKAGKALESAEIVPDVEGAGFKYFKRHCLFMLPIKAVRAPGAKTRKRVFLTNPAASDGIEVKNKFEGRMPDQVEAHWLKFIAAGNKLKV